jgi:hypothetical protein
MSDVKFGWIGWCHETDKNGSDHDKIWAIVTIGNTYYACWGARGKTVNFKKHDSFSSINQVRRSKEKKYSEIREVEAVNIWPNFRDAVEERLCYCILADNIK